jgi:hypothetical protein
VLLSEIVYLGAEDFRRHLAPLLHLVFLGLDFPMLTVYEHCRILLLNLVRGLALKRYLDVGLSRD